MKKHFLLIQCVLVFFFALISLALGAEYLYLPLVKKPFFPFGNLLTAMGYIAFSSIFYFLFIMKVSGKTELRKLFSKLFKYNIILSFFWMPIGYILSGNLSTSFGRSDSFQGSAFAGEIYWIFNYTLLGIPFLLLFVFLILSVFYSKQKSNS